MYLHSLALLLLFASFLRSVLSTFLWIIQRSHPVNDEFIPASGGPFTNEMLFTYLNVFQHFISEVFPANRALLSLNNFLVSTSWLICNNLWHSYKVQSVHFYCQRSRPGAKTWLTFKGCGRFVYDFGTPTWRHSNRSHGFGHVSENHL